MEEVVLLNNSVGAEIHGDGTFILDCLVKDGSHNVGWDDLSIQDYTCGKKDHTYAEAVH